MKRSIISLQKMIPVFSILFILWGCAPLQPSVVQLPTQKPPQSVKLRKTDFEGKGITEGEIIAGLKAIFAQSGDRGEQVTWTSNYGPSGEFSQTVRGVKIDAGMNKMIVTYYNGEKFTSYNNPGRRTNVTMKTTDIVAELPINIIDNGEDYVVNVGYPSSLTLIPRRAILGITQDQYSDTGHVAQDLETKIKAAKNLLITRYLKIEGKIDSKYGANATYANFVRVLGGGVRNVDANNLEKKNSFAMGFNGNRLTLDVSVAPYREGARVVYACIVPYTVTSSLSISRADVDSIKKEITKIVND